MSEATTPRKRKRQVHLLLTDEEFSQLEYACGVFGLGKSDLIRRLTRAAIDVGPALSAENTKELLELTKQLRAAGRNIAQIVKGVNLGYAPQLAEATDALVATHRALSEINDLVHQLTIANGSGLRRRASLKRLPATSEPG